MRIFFLLLFASIMLSCKQDSSEISTLHILSEEKIIWEEKKPCLVYVSQGNELSVASGRIKFRGGMSSKYNKHSFSLKFDESISIAGLPKNKKWIINANYIDKTFMRHKISFDLFREMDSSNKAPLCNYVKLFEDSVYRGLYVVMERMDQKRLHLNKEDTTAFIFKDAPVFRKDSIDPLKTSYQKYPTESRGKELNELREFILQSTNKEFHERIASWIDINNFMDWQLLLYFTNNSDGLLKNFYLYKQNKNTPIKIAIWDYDHSFGRDGDNEMNMLTSTVDFDRSILFERLMKDDTYRKDLGKRWNELRKNNVFSVENFEQKMNENHSIIAPYLEGNFSLWPIDDKWYFDSNPYDKEVELMVQFVKKNTERLDILFSE